MLALLGCSRLRDQEPPCSEFKNEVQTKMKKVEKELNSLLLQSKKGVQQSEPSLDKEATGRYTRRSFGS